jgi:L,D-transpeptidase-like protein
MIDRRQLSEALARLDPRDREVLDYSLRRHVPDSDLAAVFDCGPSEVARMRAGAVERLADDLGVQRGTDLGQVLTALLDHATWDDVPGAIPLGSQRAAPSAPDPEPAPPAVDASAVAPAGDDARKEPVLGMLDRRGRPVAAAGAPPPPVRDSRRWSVAIAGLIGVLIAIGLGSVIVLGDGGGSSSANSEDSATRPFEPKEEELGEPFPSEPEPAERSYRYPVAIIDRPVTLLDAPLGKPLATIAERTEWDSPRVLSVVERQGDWLAVLAPELENGEVGWIQDSDVDRLSSVGWAIKADLTTRKATVERDGETIKTFEIAIGREDHPTPTGRFAVTDKLAVTDSESPYGCCVVALTGHQTELPEGWPGGDRLAIHATNDVSGLGEAVSLGCMRTDAEDARWLMDSVPLGTPVFIEESTPPQPSSTSQGKPAKR